MFGRIAIAFFHLHVIAILVLASCSSLSVAITGIMFVRVNYQNMQQKLDQAIALRTAMLTTMKQHPFPRNWAAFTLIGEAE